MAKFCSTEARKLIETISDYGIELPHKQYFDVEQVSGTFFPNHVLPIIRKVMEAGAGDYNAKFNKVKEIGWPYFQKPIISMLTNRQGAQRNNPVYIEDIPVVRNVYDAVTENLCLIDFNIDELRFLTSELPLMIKDDILFLSRSIDACRRSDARSIFYLHGVVRREYQTAKGKAREARESGDDIAGWGPPEGWDGMDVVERRTLAAEWQEKLNSIKVSKSLNDV